MRRGETSSKTEPPLRGQSLSLHFRARSFADLTVLWSSAGIHGRGKREIPERIPRPAELSDTIPTCETTGAPPGENEPGSPWWEAQMLVDVYKTNPVLLGGRRRCADVSCRLQYEPGSPWWESADVSCRLQNEPGSPWWEAQMLVDVYNTTWFSLVGGADSAHDERRKRTSLAEERERHGGPGAAPYSHLGVDSGQSVGSRYGGGHGSGQGAEGGWRRHAGAALAAVPRRRRRPTPERISRLDNAILTLGAHEVRIEQICNVKHRAISEPELYRACFALFCDHILLRIISHLRAKGETPLFPARRPLPALCACVTKAQLRLALYKLHKHALTLFLDVLYLTFKLEITCGDDLPEVRLLFACVRQDPSVSAERYHYTFFTGSCCKLDLTPGIFSIGEPRENPPPTNGNVCHVYQVRTCVDGPVGEGNRTRYRHGRERAVAATECGVEVV
ncbi:hypothetical protein PR048_022797 [Dryococelus australis]|uniref:Uncharacterized protein n=1 Tax=Dryococelus australis TaxID=614101 RepID=A0ABQ9GS84_9NEOP|nr:hypothetical protein PR048_022797 [Dryococelus australis]